MVLKIGFRMGVCSYVKKLGFYRVIVGKSLLLFLNTVWSELFCAKVRFGRSSWGKGEGFRV